MPDRYGPWKTCHERLRIWTLDGTWAKILEEAVVKDDAIGDVEWVLSVDSTSVRAHHHAAGARKRGVPLCFKSRGNTQFLQECSPGVQGQG
ncbi:transposase [Brevibacterium aurantiacum]|uniref:Transposase n=1 Tax=Brevibacterium aurantiacum TaxID=273384 RepID=A0A556C6Q8_BREAU|nr:transposase [Brevibacterium aurantiacum]